MAHQDYRDVIAIALTRLTTGRHFGGILGRWLLTVLVLQRHGAQIGEVDRLMTTNVGHRRHSGCVDRIER